MAKPRNLRGGVALLALTLLVGACASGQRFCTGPCPVPPACARLRSRPADHVCIRDLDRYGPNYRGCAQYNADVTGFGFPGTWQGIVEMDVQENPDDFDGPAECTHWGISRGGQRAQRIRATDFEMCPNTDELCGVPQACTPMISGCFGASDGSGFIRFTSVTPDPLPAGLQYRLHGNGQGLVCPGSEWTFDDAIVGEDCASAEILLSCAGSDLTTVRLTTGGWRIRRGNQAEIALASGAGGCADPPPPPPPPDCTPTLQGCFAGPGRAWLRIDPPVCGGTGASRLCMLSGEGRGLACPNREWTFANALADDDCMGARLTPSCGSAMAHLRAAPGGATLEVGTQTFTLTMGGTCQ